MKEKGKAYLLIDRCVDAEFDRLVTRVTHQAVRNGAKQVYFCDKESPERLETGKSYGYYVFEQSHRMMRMEKPVQQLECENFGNENTGNESSDKESIGRNMPKQLVRLNWQQPHVQTEDFCRLFNEIFADVPNSATLTEEELRQRLEDEREYIAVWMEEKKAVGFLMLRTLEKNNLEIDAVGVSENFRNRKISVQMIRAAEILAENQKMEKLSLLVADSNERAYQLYQRLGFESVQCQSLWYRTSVV